MIFSISFVKICVSEFYSWEVFQAFCSKNSFGIDEFLEVFVDF